MCLFLDSRPRRRAHLLLRFFLKAGLQMVSLLTPGEVARRLGVSRQTLMRWRARGVGPDFMQVGELVRYVPESVDAYASGRVREPNA